jgi:hypothetical protein
MQRVEDLGYLTFYDWFADYFLCRMAPWSAWAKHTRRESDEAILQFYALRREFIINRTPLPPHKVPDSDKWLPANFDYATYQANCLSNFMVSIVSFTPITWVALWLFIVLIFIFLIIVDGEYLWLSLVWVALTYISLGLIYALDRKAEWVIEQLLNPAFLRVEDSFPDDDDKEGAENSGGHPTARIINRLNNGVTCLDKALDGGSGNTTAAAREDTPLFSKARAAYPTDKSDALNHIHRLRITPTTNPGWVDSAHSEPGFLTVFFYGRKAVPNKQHLLMWGDFAGPDLNSFLLRVFLIIQSLYIAVLAVYFAPYMFEHEGDLIGTIYLLVALAPEVILYLGFYPRLVMNLTQITSTGLLKQNQIVSEVIRNQKSAKLVRLLMMLTKLKAASKKEKRANLSYVPKKYDLSDPDVRTKIAEFERVFKLYDTDGRGTF